VRPLDDKGFRARIDPPVDRDPPLRSAPIREKGSRPLIRKRLDRWIVLIGAQQPHIRALRAGSDESRMISSCSWWQGTHQEAKTLTSVTCRCGIPSEKSGLSAALRLAQGRAEDLLATSAEAEANIARIKPTRNSATSSEQNQRTKMRIGRRAACEPACGRGAVGASMPSLPDPGWKDVPRFKSFRGVLMSRATRTEAPAQIQVIAKIVPTYPATIKSQG